MAPGLPKFAQDCPRMAQDCLGLPNMAQDGAPKDGFSDIALDKRQHPGLYTALSTTDNVDRKEEERQRN